MDAALDESSPIREALRNRGFCIEIRHPSTHRAKFAANPASQIRTRIQQAARVNCFYVRAVTAFRVIMISTVAVPAQPTRARVWPSESVQGHPGRTVTIP